MARASTRRKSRRAAIVEEYWTLVGQRRGRLWLARRIDHQAGERACVAFDGQRVLEREERRGDVIGFLHTHPDGTPGPSSRDVRTMRAWVGAFAKPMLCVIGTSTELAGWRFEDDHAQGTPLAQVELFSRGIVIAVE